MLFSQKHPQCQYLDSEKIKTQQVTEQILLKKNFKREYFTDVWYHFQAAWKLPPAD